MVKALIESLACANASADPTAQRNLTLHLADAAGAGIGDDAYSALTDGADPLAVVTLGAGSAPAFVDLDVVVGNDLGTLRAYADIGGGKYAELTGAANPFDGMDVGFASSPAFADPNGDGDPDLVVGEGWGALRVFAQIQTGLAFAVTVTAGNDVPVLADAAPTLPDQAEGAAPASSLTGGATDPDGDDPIGIGVTGIAHGVTLHVSHDGGAS